MSFRIEIEAECESGLTELDSLRHRERLLITLLEEERMHFLKEQVEESLRGELGKVRKQINQILK